MKRKLVCWIMAFGLVQAQGQMKPETQNIILITLDGFRWQELFRGADPTLLRNRAYVDWPDSMKQFAGPTGDERRKKLLPFFWKTLALEGQLYGNRDMHNRIDCSNPYWFSYPGYHEMLVGAVDPAVCSNLKRHNPNSTVLGFLNQQPDYVNSVAVFSTWDVFPYILNAPSSGIPVNAGPDKIEALPDHNSDENDSATFHSAFEYLRKERPRILYIALDETDYFAHHDRYDRYLLAAHHSDQWIAQLWDWVQQEPGYSGKTTLLISTDHGRGQNSKKSWRHHGRFTRGSGQIWLAGIGPDTPGNGEIKLNGQLYQKQIAKTIAALVGLNYENVFPLGAPIESLMKPPVLVAERRETPGRK